ncbi:hypothetical protein [Thauera sp. SDU_THAU2]|uniref:hypothetical protein n=1 Tax=Thauera sp. SDU_THAU2 TaxID=3136633 RepID=UPI00311E8734
MPYYPPHLAEEILESAVDYKGMYPVPDSRRHMLSFIYHAVYHKAEQSDLPFGAGDKQKSLDKGKHSHADLIRSLFHAMDINEPVSFLSLHQFLLANGWGAPTDLLRKMGVKSRWHRELYKPNRKRRGRGSSASSSCAIPA